MSQTILQMFDEAVAKYGNNPYLYEARKGVDYTSMTYSEVHEKVRLFAGGLISMGLQPEDRVALISEGKNNWVIGELGILSAAATSVPLSVKLETEQDITFRINHSECCMVLASDQQIAKLRPLKDKLQTVNGIFFSIPSINWNRTRFSSMRWLRSEENIFGKIRI